MLFILENYYSCKNMGIFFLGGGGTFCTEFKWQEVALNQHDTMFANITLFCTVMVYTKEIYKLERLVDGRLMSTTLSECFFYFI